MVCFKNIKGNNKYYMRGCFLIYGTGNEYSPTERRGTYICTVETRASQAVFCKQSCLQLTFSAYYIFNVSHKTERLNLFFKEDQTDRGLILGTSQTPKIFFGFDFSFWQVSSSLVRLFCSLQRLLALGEYTGSNLTGRVEMRSCIYKKGLRVENILAVFSDNVSWC